MEAILNNGMFWGALTIAFIVASVEITARYQKKQKPTTN